MAADRDERGRLLPGHSVKSPGNPALRAVAAYKEAFKQAITPDELRALAVKCYRDAMNETGEVPVPIVTHARTMVVERLAGAVKVDVEVIGRGVHDFGKTFAPDAAAAIEAITRDRTQEHVEA